MSGPRKFFGGRTIANRSTFDRINPKYVPPSRHAIFIRGFPNDVDNHKIREFFQDAAKSNCGIDFTSYNEEQRKLSIALRFESHDIAKDILTRFNNTEVFGYRLDITWFKDLKKARDRMNDDKRIPYDDNRMNYKPNRFDYDRKENRDWSDNRKRFQPNNNNHNRSKSIERGDANSDMSYGNHKQSSDYERSRSKSSNRSDKSYSKSEDYVRCSPSIKGSRDKLSQLGMSEKPSAYRVDLDEPIDVLHPIKPVNKTERVLSQIDSLPDEGLCKPDFDDRKKKKKKRKRRHMDHSGSQDSYAEPIKMSKYTESLERNDFNQFAAIAGDLNNWKQSASDSDDFLTKNKEISKSKSRLSLTKSDKINNEKSVKMLSVKVESIEKAYKKDSETYSNVINVLIRKAPELKTKLETLMKEILVDASNQCMDSMRDYILHWSDNNNNNPETSMSPLSSV